MKSNTRRTRAGPHERRFATVSPLTPRGKWLVVARRIGGGERYDLIAECRTEVSADMIVNALTLIRAIDTEDPDVRRAA